LIPTGPDKGLGLAKPKEAYLKNMQIKVVPRVELVLLKNNFYGRVFIILEKSMSIL